MTVRKATLNDAEFLYELNKNDYGYDYPLDETKIRLQKVLNRNSDIIFVAEDNDIVVGYIHACDYDVFYAPHYKNIMGFVVRKDYRKQGIGRKLLDAIEAWAKETGAVGVRLNSNSKRIDAHKVYEHCGYVSEKTQLNFKKNLT